MLTSSAVDRECRLGKTKDYQIGICCFSVKHTALRRKSKDWLARNQNKMNCELMLTYDTPALWQIGSRNLTGQKTLPTIWGTYMKLVTKYQISAINSC